MKNIIPKNSEKSYIGVYTRLVRGINVHMSEHDKEDFRCMFLSLTNSVLK